MASGKEDGVPAKIEPTSPFYLGPQDRPGDLITHVRLKLDNFDDWSHSVRVALRSRRKFGFLNGSITKPVPPCTQDDWETIHCMLVSWLMSTIDPEVTSLLSKYDNAKKLWDNLHERFRVVNGLRVHQLKSQIHNCAQTVSMSIAVYFGKLNMLWDELDKFEPLISCTCGKCECDVGKQHALRRDSDRLHQFLLGLLHAEYRSVRSVLLSQDPLPTLNKAFQTISQEESAGTKAPSVNTNLEVQGFAVRSSPRSSVSRSPSSLSRTERRALLCSHCHKKGHDISMCFDLLDDKPDWWYELKGRKPPVKGGPVVENRPSGSSIRKVAGSSNNLSPATITTHAVDGGSHVGGASANQVTIYGTPSHTFSGPTDESGDWHW